MSTRQAQQHDEAQKELLDILEDLEIFISPSSLREKHSENEYHKFKDHVVQPLIDKGELVEIPNSTKGKLVQTRTKAEKLMENAIKKADSKKT